MASEDFVLKMSRSLTVGELLGRASRQYPNLECLVFNEKRYVYSQLDERVNRLANALISLGLTRNVKAATLSLNSIEVIETYFAIAKAGGVVVPVNFRLAPVEIVYIINNSDTELLVFSKDYLSIIKDIKAKIPKVKTFICIDCDAEEGILSYEKLISEHETTVPEVLVSEEDPAFIVYTSGTTGFPKGALIAHKSFITYIVNCTSAVRWFRFAVNISVLPLFHIAGICGTLQSVYLAGKSVLLDFEPGRVLQTIQDEKINIGLFVPTIWNLILNHPRFKEYNLESLKVAFTGAAIMPLEMKKLLLRSFPNAGLYETFGQTETCSGVVYLTAEDALRKTNSVGRPGINSQVRVVDENMQDVPVGEVGEIIFRGPNIMMEYYNNPEATAEVFRGGWLHSGDLVRMDEEGYIYIVDRKKDMIISGGENIYPAEVEKVLYEHPKVFEAAVIGVTDELWGESVVAVIQARPNEQLTVEEIDQHCLQNLARYKRPRRIEFIDAIPKNASGKILKTMLRKIYNT